MYSTQRRHKSEFQPTDEEQQLRAFMKSYKVHGERTADFIPSWRLYQNYRTWYLRAAQPGDPDVLTPIQFGAAIGRLLPRLAGRRVMRQRQWGYLGIVGPGSITVRTERGRPRKQK